MSSAGAKEEKRFRPIKARLVSVEPGKAEETMKQLVNNPRVAYVEPNYVVKALALPNDPSFGQLWGLRNTGQIVQGVAGTPDADIDADEAWDVTTGSTSTEVAVIDTGVDFGHVDLGASQRPARSCGSIPARTARAAARTESTTTGTATSTTTAAGTS